MPLDRYTRIDRDGGCEAAARRLRNGCEMAARWRLRGAARPAARRWRDGSETAVSQRGVLGAFQLRFRCVLRRFVLAAF